MHSGKHINKNIRIQNTRCPINVTVTNNLKNVPKSNQKSCCSRRKPWEELGGQPWGRQKPWGWSTSRGQWQRSPQTDSGLCRTWTHQEATQETQVQEGSLETWNPEGTQETRNLEENMGDSELGRHTGDRAMGRRGERNQSSLVSVRMISSLKAVVMGTPLDNREDIDRTIYEQYRSSPAKTTVNWSAEPTRVSVDILQEGRTPVGFLQKVSPKQGGSP